MLSGLLNREGQEDDDNVDDKIISLCTISAYCFLGSIQGAGSPNPKRLGVILSQ